ncbi:site-specific integrase [Streptomyces tsukubensis]|uniref:Tyr recombinase domain-containing protein n=1 Tax=Streptomyces tsukubensis TaxID=83656 RepID=A0A1V4A8A9_9ACTN|nr:site-specific integrase [Streptomyces tsukubensis]OON79169.1 hypothetical protein B1H18_14430 [Streptomyces tsukubensis]QFR94720.1 tyrosine-type recombinase/integrase [Streptomyces tsukubensis]
MFLEREEYAILRSHVHADSVDLVDALAATGLRWSEMAALPPRDLTLHGSRPMLRVQRAWKRIDGGKALGAPKTKRSRRTLVLSPYLVQPFKRNCAGKQPNDFVFTAPEGGAWDSGGFYHAWTRAVSTMRVGRPRSPPRPVTASPNDRVSTTSVTRPQSHDLSHTHASWLIAKKVPLPGIQARLGHESITTTVDRYGHPLAMLDDEIIEAIEWSMNPMAA